MFSLAMFIPATLNFCIISGVFEAGPIVQAIPVFLVGCLGWVSVVSASSGGGEMASMSKEARHASLLVDSKGRVCSWRVTRGVGDRSLSVGRCGLAGGLCEYSEDDMLYLVVLLEL